MRLIDADKLKECIGDVLFKPTLHEVIQIIDKQPTAFDKEKVMFQISFEATDANDNAWGSMGGFDYWDGVEDGLNNAYDIVERGGIDG